MQQEEIINYVVNALGRHRSRNDIIQHVCEQGRMTWPEAEKLVKQIEVRHGTEINARQSPLILALGIISMIGGLVLIGYCGIYFVILSQQDTVGMVKSSRGVFAAIVALISGIGLIVGSIAGMWKTIKDFFEHKDNR